MTSAETHRRSIRSFIRRTGRMTEGQKRALNELWPQYGLDNADELLDFETVFGRASDVVFEIGFGNGESLVQLAAENPAMDFLGAEVHEPGVGHCLLQAAELQLTNLRVVIEDAIQVLQTRIADKSLARVNLLFPDPWPKKRHHKRRIVQPSFLDLVAGKLSPDGALYIATDWANYAEHIDELIADSDHFRVAERRQHAGDQPLDRPNTKFEKRGLKLDHTIWDWRLERI